MATDMLSIVHHIYMHDINITLLHIIALQILVSTV